MEKPIEGYEDLYSISSEGAVISMHRQRRVLRPRRTRAGYERVNLCDGKSRKEYLIHRLVAAHFVPNPQGFPEVNHKDGHKSNNRVGNLEWVNHAQNTKHSYDIGLRDGQRVAVAARNVSRCARPVVAISVRDGTKVAYPSMAEASRDGFSGSKISLCVAGRRKTHGGFVWVAA